jgi:hypothetical protein
MAAMPGQIQAKQVIFPYPPRLIAEPRVRPVTARQVAVSRGRPRSPAYAISSPYYHLFRTVNLPANGDF